MDSILNYSKDHKTVIGCGKFYSGEIIIPEGIISIADNAFENCSIRRIVLPLSLTKIGRRAFADNSNLIEVLFNEGLIEIGSYAFSGCSSLKINKLPSLLTKLGDNNYSGGGVFSGCITLNSIEIPKGVTKIPRKTFAGCVNLLSITLPETIRTIDYDAFENCVSLQKVITTDIMSWCYLIKLSNPLEYAHHLYIGNKEIVNLDIPDKIDNISSHTFEKCTGIKKVCFPEGNVDVGKDAFKGCVGIKEVTVNSNNVGEILNAFIDCDNIEVITIKHFDPNYCIGLKGFKKLKAVYSIDDNGEKTMIDIDSIISTKAREIKLMSMFYHGINMNLTMVQGKYPSKSSFKTPINREGMMLENLYHSPQDSSTLLKQDWLNATGMGLVLGWNDYRALDFDNIAFRVEGFDDDREYGVREYIRESLLILGLPEDYQWVVWSGSRNGFHIIIRVEDFEEKDLSRIAYAYYPCSSSEKRIELRWRGHLLLPPSIYNSGETYRFFNNQIPTTEPAYIGIGKIELLLDYYCGENHYSTYNWGKRSFEIVERIKRNAESDSQGIHYDSDEERKGRNYIKWLENSATSQSYNTLAIKYLLGEDVPANKYKALEYFKMAASQKYLKLTHSNIFGDDSVRICEVDNSHAFFNIASLMSIGYFEGTQHEINDYLENIKIEDLYLPGAWDDPFPEEHIELKIERIRKQSAKYIHNCTYLFFDTETTGEPINYKASSSDTENWPRLVQLAWILEDESGVKIDSGNEIIIPDSFSIPNEAVKVHGITTEKAIEDGVPLDNAIRDFLNNLDVATFVVGHNIDFDKKIVGAEMIRLGMKDELDKKKSYCTMQSSINFCKISGKYGYKYPKLQELYRKLFGKDFDNAHDAMSDVEATEKCFWELKKRKLI